MVVAAESLATLAGLLADRTRAAICQALLDGRAWTAGELTRAPASSVAGTVYLGVVPTALAFSTWAYALARTDAGRLGVTTYLVPPLVIALAWVLLDEVPPVLAVVGGVVCLAGVAVSRRRDRPAAVVPQEAGPAV